MIKTLYSGIKRKKEKQTTIIIYRRKEKEKDECVVPMHGLVG
jgi:hypothetical protein